MPVSYNYIFVALSVFIGMSAAYAALDLAARIRAANGLIRSTWLIGGAVAVGIGVWSMHFTGMLAFSLPVPVDYDWLMVLLSLLAGIFAAGISLFILSQETSGTTQIAFAAVIVGLSIITVHNVGMRAMRMPANYRYNPQLASLAVVLAMLFSLASLWLGIRFKGKLGPCDWRKFVGALVAGAAISSVHYFAMAATTFWPSAPDPDVSHVVRISTIGAAAIAMATLIVQGLAMLTSFLDRRAASQEVEQLASELRHSHEEERRRIARDLHDDVGSGLYAVKLELGRLRESGVDSTARQSLSEAVDMVAESMQKVRTISQVLYPPELDMLGFRAAIVVYVDGFRERSKIQVALDIPERLPHLSRHAESALLKVIRECLLNIVRHSGSQKVQIRIQVDPSRLTLEISDDGHGMKPEILDRLRGTTNLGVGTKAMFGRIEELGGRLEIHSGRWGTSVKAIISIGPTS
jgi:NO-binding membrane sensor protein with MHYT domain